MLRATDTTLLATIKFLNYKTVGEKFNDSNMKYFRFFLLILLVMNCRQLFAQALKPLTDFDVVNYSIGLEVSKRSDTVKVSTFITIKLLHPTDTLVFDYINKDESNKGMDILSVKVSDNTAAYWHKDNLLRIKNTDIAGNYRKVAIISEGVPANGLIIGKNLFGERTWFSDHWPNRARYWLPCVDHVADKATFNWTVIVPPSYTVTANGEPEKEFGSTDRALKHWHFVERNPIPIKVASVGIGFFQKDCSFNTCVPVCNYYYTDTYAKGKEKFKDAESILKFYDSLIAPYPYKKLNNVQSTTMFGGMENAGNIFYDERAIDGDRSNEDLVAHEIAHQWFGNTVTEKNFSHLWLSEGFATFFTNYYIEKKYGVDSFNQRINADRRRVERFLKASKRPVIDTSSNYMSLLNANSYQKGGLFLEALRRYVGEQVFFKIIREYYQLYKYKNADTDDFIKVAERISAKSLKALTEKWLYSVELPEL